MKRASYFLIGILLLTAPVGTGNAAAPKGKDAYWHLTRNSDPKTGAFDYCATESSFDNGLSLAFARNQDFFTNIVIGFSQSKLEKQTKYPLQLVVDQNAPLSVTGFAADAKALVIPLKQNQQFISQLAKGGILDMRGPRDSVKFSLQGAADALNKLQDCVERSVAEKDGQGNKTPAAKTTTAASAPSGTSGTQAAAPIILPYAMGVRNDAMIQPLPLAEPSPVQEEAANTMPEPVATPVAEPPASMPEPQAQEVFTTRPESSPSPAAVAEIAPPTQSPYEAPDQSPVVVAPPSVYVAPTPANTQANVNEAPPLPPSAIVERPPVVATSLGRTPARQTARAASALPVLSRTPSEPAPVPESSAKPLLPTPRLSDSTDALNHMEASDLPPVTAQAPMAVPTPVEAPVAAVRTAPAPQPLPPSVARPALPKLVSAEPPVAMPTPMSPAATPRQPAPKTSLAQMDDTTDSLNQLGTGGMENIPAARPTVINAGMPSPAISAPVAAPAPAPALSPVSPPPLLPPLPSSAVAARASSPSMPKPSVAPAAQAAGPLPSDLRPQEQIVSSTSSTVIVPAVAPPKTSQPMTPVEAQQPPAAASASIPMQAAVADSTLPALPPLITSRRSVFPSAQSTQSPQSIPDNSLADILSTAGIDAVGHPVPDSTQVSYSWSQNNIAGSGIEMPVSSASLDDFSMNDIDRRARQCNGKFSPRLGAARQSGSSIMVAESAATCTQGGKTINTMLFYFKTAGKMGVIALETPAENQAFATAMRDRIIQALKSNSN